MGAVLACVAYAEAVPIARKKWAQHACAQLRRATGALLKHYIPEFADRLYARMQQLVRPRWQAGQLAYAFHEAGVNMRHAGLVRSHLPAQSVASRLVLVEMVARSLKVRFSLRPGVFSLSLCVSCLCLCLSLPVL